MVTSKARVPTVNGSKYATQLGKHWAHKLDVELSKEAARVNFDDANSSMSWSEAELIVTIEARDVATLDRMKDVIAHHLDRFAFREAPLQFDWRPPTVAPAS